MSAFEWDGDTFPVINDPRVWLMDEVDAIEEYFGKEFTNLSRRELLRAIAYVSIRRKRKEFTLPAAGEVPLGFAVTDEMLQDAKAKAEKDDTVLSPTNAVTAPPNRAERRSASKSGSTLRP